MIFIDSNVPMYLVGAPHPNKDRALAILTQSVRDGEQFVTDVEVYQEILHRYTAIQRPDAIDAAFESSGRDCRRRFGLCYARNPRCQSADRLGCRSLRPGRFACGDNAKGRYQSHP